MDRATVVVVSTCTSTRTIDDNLTGPADGNELHSSTEQNGTPSSNLCCGEPTRLHLFVDTVSKLVLMLTVIGL